MGGRCTGMLPCDCLTDRRGHLFVLDYYPSERHPFFANAVMALPKRRPAAKPMAAGRLRCRRKGEPKCEKALRKRRGKFRVNRRRAVAVRQSPRGIRIDLYLSPSGGNPRKGSP